VKVCLEFYGTFSSLIEEVVKMQNKFIRMLSFVLALSLLLIAVGLTSAQDGVKRVVTGISMVGGDIPTIDPQLAETSSSIEVINQLFIGLTAQDVTNNELIDGMASFEVVNNDDGTATYTFHITEGVPWVRYNMDTDEVEEVTDDEGNVRYVNAHDFYYGIVRGLDPRTASPYSYIPVSFVTGAAEFNGSESADDAELQSLIDTLGVRVVDDYTIEIDAPDNTSFTPYIYGLWVMRAVPQWAIEEAGDAWVEPRNFQSYGPFALKDWAHEESITIVKNPFWPGVGDVPPAMLDEVVFRFLDPQQQLAEYEAGTMDAIGIPLEAIDRINADPDLSAQRVSGTNPCSYYIGFDNTEAPTDNVHLRRALSLAVDRETIVTNITKRGEEPATMFTRPDVNAAPTNDMFPDAGIQYDPEAAQEEFTMALEELGLSDGSELQLSLSYNESSGHAAIAQAIQQMWSDTLGLNVTLDPREPSTYFASLSEDAPPAYRAGWCQDYPDTNSYLYDVFFSGSSQNDTGFFNEEFDQLVSDARLSLDDAARQEMYARAEEILVDEQAAIIPIYWYALALMVKPDVERADSVTGNEAYYLWDVNR
jgi:oligopeptide transport system substrate-binding protein